MPRLGRDFEKLIAQIEKKLCPTGARVKSPDRIPDLVTGELREVDASIRTVVGSANILITIECRDRSAVQDVIWMEQLNSKQANIGANLTIAVSRNGFSKAAVIKAKQYGIALRELSAVTEEFILRCVQNLNVFIVETSSKLHSYNIGFWPEIEDEGLMRLELTDEMRRNIEADLYFVESKFGIQLTLRDLFKEAREEALLIHKDELEIEYELPIEIDAHYEQGVIWTQTESGKRYIRSIIFTGRIRSIANRLPALEPIRYTDESGKILDSFSMTKDAESGLCVRVKFDWDEKSAQH